MRPEYQSETYYSVVIRNGEFMGWRAPDVGGGKMRFVHPDHGELKVKEHKFGQDDWMEDCWNQFLDHAFQCESLKLINRR